MACPEEEKKDDGRSDAFANRLLKTRTVLVSGEVDQEMAERVIAQLLVLDAEENAPIRVFITSQGGHVDSGYAIYDVMRLVRSRIITVGTGWVASIGVPILLGASENSRFSLPNTRFLLHQPSGGAGGQLADLRIEAQEILKIRERINKLIAVNTGQTPEKVAKDSDRNYWMSADEALAYGLITKIVQSADEIV